MIKIKVEGGSLDSALKKLKFKFAKLKIRKELTNRKEFVKPSIERREEIRKASYIQNLRDEEDRD
jgi:small subunit ribosomal protein S21